MNKAIFLDKDGTLITDVPYNVSLQNVVLEEGVADGLQMLQRMGYKLVVISNQPGISHGYFEEEDLYKVHRHIQQLSGVRIDGFYYCPHAESKVADAVVCNCRKPGPGLLYQAARDLEIELQQSWMIGDILNDVEAGNRAGCRTILIDNGNETEWELHKERVPDFIVHNFSEAVVKIKRHTKLTDQHAHKLVGM